MTTMPGWTEADWARSVAEPFRSDRDFWAGLAASADALIGLLAAIAVAIVMVLTGAGLWSLLPLAVPAALILRATVVSRSSSRHSQAAFPDRRAWRDAERSAVATAFPRVIGHRHKR
jgi:hypothetical protein